MDQSQIARTTSKASGGKQMNHYGNLVIQNKYLKESFVKKFNVLEKDVQEFFYELIELFQSNSTVTGKLLIDFAKNPEKYAYYMFDWTKTDSEIQTRAEDILSSITILIDRDGSIYNMTIK